MKCGCCATDSFPTYMKNSWNLRPLPISMFILEDTLSYIFSISVPWGVVCACIIFQKVLHPSTKKSIIFLHFIPLPKLRETPARCQRLLGDEIHGTRQGDWFRPCITITLFGIFISGRNNRWYMDDGPYSMDPLAVNLVWSNFDVEAR